MFRFNKPCQMKATIKKYLLALSAYLFFLFYGLAVLAQDTSRVSYSEIYRPQFHFSPKKGWIGDPCGLLITRVNTKCIGGERPFQKTSSTTRKYLPK